jgi:hypothetical protein
MSEGCFSRFHLSRFSFRLFLYRFLFLFLFALS